MISDTRPIEVCRPNDTSTAWYNTGYEKEENRFEIEAAERLKKQEAKHKATCLRNKRKRKKKKR